jgi:hypothetical protein
MKKLFVLLLLPLLMFGYSIVFVHIGEKAPSYLKESITQAQLFNPQTTIYVLGNQKALKSFFKKNSFKNVQAVYLENIKKLPTHEQFLEKYSLDKIHHNILWRVSIERFFYLASFIKQNKLQDVFHLENDNMLYTDLSQDLSIFREKYPTIGATLDNDDRCIAGFFYINNPEALISLTNYIADHAKENLTDMSLIGKFYKETKGLNLLPIVPESYHAIHTLKSMTNLSSQNPSIFSQNINLFHSLFDAAALGQYLGGVDTNYNSELHIGFINESALFQAKNFNFVWQKDAQDRRVPYVKFDGKLYKINNLHIHSKQLNLFRS